MGTGLVSWHNWSGHQHFSRSKNFNETSHRTLKGLHERQL